MKKIIAMALTPAYMFFRTSFAFFDYSEPRIFFFLDYLAVMILFAVLGCEIMKLFPNNRSTK